MFERERIQQLHDQGYCTAYISLRLNVPSDTVRAVLAKAAAKVALRNLRPEAVRRDQRAKAEAKRDRALQLLAEATSILEP